MEYYCGFGQFSAEPQPTSALHLESIRREVASSIAAQSRGRHVMDASTDRSIVTESSADAGSGSENNHSDDLEMTVPSSISEVHKLSNRNRKRNKDKKKSAMSLVGPISSSESDAPKKGFDESSYFDTTSMSEEHGSTDKTVMHCCVVAALLF